LVERCEVRRDAQRNLEKLIRAARDVFAERGLDAPLEQIAQRAGVSIGTLYNRFPDRFALIDAVLLDRMQENLRIGEAGLAHDDPWQGFVGYLEQTCALQAGDRGITDAISRRFPRAPKVDAACADGFVQARQLIERAQRHGGLRADFTVGDLISVLWANARIVEATISVNPNAWRRYLRFVLDGLHADAAHPIADPPLRPEQIDQARLDLGVRR
jgi:AcrR family transcriptional regulator